MGISQGGEGNFLFLKLSTHHSDKLPVQAAREDDKQDTCVLSVVKWSFRQLPVRVQGWTIHQRSTCGLIIVDQGYVRP